MKEFLAQLNNWVDLERELRELVAYEMTADRAGWQVAYEVSQLLDNYGMEDSE